MTLIRRPALVILLLAALLPVAGCDSSNAQDGVSANADNAAVRAAAQTFGAGDKNGPMHRVGYDLALIFEEHRDYLERGGRSRLKHAFRSRLELARTREDRVVLIDALANGDRRMLMQTLERIGMQNLSAAGRTLSGWLPITALPQLAESTHLRFARPSYALTLSGSVTSQGDVAQASDIARSLHSVDGNGVTVGVLSDSFDCLGGAGADIASGDLPAGGVDVLAEYTNCSDGSDEGRAMAQIVHDVAPGADLAFHTAFEGIADFANGILELATAGGADVITDDVIYLAEPMFQDGVIAQAVDDVNALGVAYYAAAGNRGSRSYEADFIDSGERGHRPWHTPHDFDSGPGVDTLMAVTLVNNQTVTLVLQWDDPAYSASGAPGAESDVDLFLYNETGSSVLASSQNGNIGGDPVEILTWTNDTGVDATLQISVQHAGGPLPGTIKFVWFRANLGIQEYATNSATLYGHANAAGAVATGAAAFYNTPAFGVSPPVKEGFSAKGGVPILFDSAGSPVNILRQKPEIVAPDGGNTTFFGSDSSRDSDSDPNFFGTSASAPHAAAVAALLKQLDPLLTPAGITTAMTSSAIDMNGTGFDVLSGFGLLQADAALGTIDADADGILNPVDNCIDIANPLQDDFDEDGAGDACDADDDNDGLDDVDEVLAGSDPFDADTDDDLTEDGVDNCLLVSNAAQHDSDSDGFGNFCDADLDNSGRVNATDLAIFKSRFRTSDADADFDSDGRVNATDLAILKTLFAKPPGPSAYSF